MARALADFQIWLAECVSEETGEQGREGERERDKGPTSPPVDLHTLVGQFTALRHEVHLQTRATRAQQEQSGEVLTQLSQALDELRHAQDELRQNQEQNEEQASDEQLRPLLRTLVELHDALSLAQREMQRGQGSAQPIIDEMLALAEAPLVDEFPSLASPEASQASKPTGEEKEPGEAPASQGETQKTGDQTTSDTARPSFFARLLGTRRPDPELQAMRRTLVEMQNQLATWLTPREQIPAQELRRCQEEVRRWESLCQRMEEAHRASATRIRTQGEKLQQMLSSLVTGYTMSLQRIERALEKQGLQPISAEGERFDPERMEVVDVVHDSGQPSGEVLEEVRRGYLWKGRIFRYAQVRVAANRESGERE